MRSIWLVFAVMFLGTFGAAPRKTTGVSHKLGTTAQPQDGTQPPLPPCVSDHCPKP